MSIHDPLLVGVRFLKAGFLLVFLVSCANKTNIDNALGAADQLPTVTSEETEICPSSNPVFSSGVTLNGNAEFEFYQPMLNGWSGLKSQPIRGAEVRLYGADKTLVACSHTDANGAFTFALDRPASTAGISYVVKVYAMANTDYVKTKIQNNHLEKKTYFLGQSFTVSGDSEATLTLNKMVAPATGTLEGGAFNIFEQLAKANEFLRTHSTTPGCTMCQPFTVAPFLKVYWEKGRAPNEINGADWLPFTFIDIDLKFDTEPFLAVSGGAEGNIDATDTDHFDNSVILYSYSLYLISLTGIVGLGGVHSANQILDPRTALAYGVAYFLSQAILDDPNYIDSTSGPNAPFYNVGVVLDSESGSHDSIVSKSPIGEGIYREFSIARALWDYIDDNADQIENPAGGTITENSRLAFAYVWAALSHPQYGLANPNLHFLNMGHLNGAIKGILTDLGMANEIIYFDQVRNAEYQTEDQSAFGSQLKTLSSNLCSMSLTPVLDANWSQSFSKNLFLSSKFYTYYHSGGPFELSLAYVPTDLSDPPDLNLRLGLEKSNDRTQGLLVPGGESSHSRETENPLNSESISLSDLSEGFYLIEVTAKTTETHAGSSASFNLKIGTNYLCP